MISASFVIPAYNSATWLPHAVRSALEQDAKNVEVVIVNDCSTDTTDKYLHWLAKQSNPLIKIINNEKNLGRSDSRNIGNANASGEYIFVLDADDVAMPNRVSLSLKKMSESKSEFVYGSAVIIDALGRRCAEDVRTSPFELEKAIETKLNRIVHSTVAYSRKFAYANPYESGDVARLGIDDWCQQIKAAISGQRFENIIQTISCHRIHSGGITANRSQSEVDELKGKIIAEALKAVAQ